MKVNHTKKMRDVEQLFPTQTVLVVSAHPDDYEIGCGGTIKLFTGSGFKVYGLILTDGERGGHGEKRMKDAKISAKFLGMKDVFFGRKTDGKVTDDIDHVDAIERIIKQVSPDMVLTHSVHDRHQDHRHCSTATTAAARNVPTLLMYETQNSTQFEPHFFFNITKTLKDKIKALKVHTCQIKKGSIDLEAVKATARYRGLQFNVKYAEGFEINHMLANHMLPRK